MNLQVDKTAERGWLLATAPSVYLGLDAKEERKEFWTHIPRASALSRSSSFANTGGTLVIGFPVARWYASMICWEVSGSAERPRTL